MRLAVNLILIFLSLFIVLSCSDAEQKKEPDKKITFRCTAEILDSTGTRFAEATGKELFFQNVDCQSDLAAFSGNYSSRQTPEKPYGFTTVIHDVKPDDYIKVSAWRKSKNENGVIAIDGGNGFYNAEKKLIENNNGWQKITAEYFVPPNFNSGDLKIYTWNNGPDTVFFDDFSITHKKSKDYPKYENISSLHFYIDDRDLDKFNQKRLVAFENTVLENNDEDYISTIIFDGTDFLDAKIRLKGDLVDHLQGQKWSFRVKLKQNFTWNNLRTFSIQNPTTRHFLHEWIAHKIFDTEDVLTTRYGFVPIKINEKSLGIYAWEEHFEKQLVESRSRREGPIIRFDESLFWKSILETNVTGRNWDIDYFNAAQIRPFKEGKTTHDPTLKPQFLEAQKLLLQYKKLERPVSEIFNVDQLAKYYALIDLTQAYHGFAWHNQRFYYNPVTCLLEPIAFDGYIEDGIFKRVEEPLLSLLNPSKIQSLRHEELMLFQVFSDNSFNKKYVKYLKEYSEPQFIENIISTYKSETDSLTRVIRQEFPYFKFNFEYLTRQAAIIRTNLPRIESNISVLKKEINRVKHTNFQHQYTKDINPNLIPFLVQAYFNAEKNEIKILNYHNGEIRIPGAFVENQLPDEFEPSLVLKPYDGITPDNRTVNVDGEPVKILFTANNNLYETTVKQWPLSEGKTTRQNLLDSIAYNSTFQEDTIIFDGEYQFKADVIIPSSKKVLVKPGTKIDFVQSAGFFSFAEVKIDGTEKNPVVIFSSDHSAQGFNVLKPEARSKIYHARFEGLSSLHRGGWQSPAAVNFYEADVDFENCIFASNFNCDDALNVVRSDFNVKNCRFENTFADAFDSDFSTGEVYRCSFENTGNDAIDFSGSKVNISECKMTEISDKAISGGEDSKLTISKCEINKANIAVAAKDLSTLKLNKITTNQTVYGLVAFQKKPEFGPATIIIDNVKMKKNMVFHKIEKGSKLTLNGRTIYGREKKLVVKLYQ